MTQPLEIISAIWGRIQDIISARDRSAVAYEILDILRDEFGFTPEEIRSHFSHDHDMMEMLRNTAEEDSDSETYGDYEEDDHEEDGYGDDDY